MSDQTVVYPFDDDMYGTYYYRTATSTPTTVTGRLTMNVWWREPPVWATSEDVIPDEPKETMWTSEKITGWRRWYLKMENFLEPPLLVGGYGQTWLPGRDKEATCYINREGPVPHWDCNCGLYAAKNRETLDRFDWYQNYPVSGTVEMYGRVIEHEIGWRAQYAHIRDLQVEVPGPWGGYLTAVLSEVYKVPVTQKQQEVN